MKKALLILIVCPVLVFSQTRKQRKEQAKADTEIVNHLRAHVQYLAGDQLEGRSAGTAAALLATQYISKQFSLAGLEPKGTDEYKQEFPITAGKQLPVAGNIFEVNGEPLQLNSDYFPMPYSALHEVTGNASPGLREKGEPWFWDIKETLEENKGNPHFDIHTIISQEAVKAGKKGAKALIVFNSSKQDDAISFNKRDTTLAAQLPVLYITRTGFKKHFADITATYELHSKVAIVQPTRTARNVIGYINNNAPTTIILGAHYDHPGYGEDSSIPDGKDQTHNGADDNASGTAALIELARLLKAANDRNNNYLFIAFSGKEPGLPGATYWLEHPSVSIVPNYMINIDMVGRYNSNKPLTIGGYGTSPVWAQVLPGIPAETLVTRFDSSGGSGDHAAFYRKQIPVLFFFANNHEDYQKAGDDRDKLNYPGTLAIMRYIQQVIAGTANQGKLTFHTYL